MLIMLQLATALIISSEEEEFLEIIILWNTNFPVTQWIVERKRKKFFYLELQ